MESWILKSDICKAAVKPPMKGEIMPRTYTVTEYDKADIEKLDFMSKQDVIETLEHIGRGWLPQDCVYSPREYETYTES